ncbi:hypothetical protein HMPREF0724_10171 [Prescottella equi ATCC 33707]|uniref:Uncharacterized protein n=1 Tax=Prescottella equi ATCC 33707 TaxID=525370 RepID=E9SVA3_RHOHA|nr:hypothetical protein HMPREF0724_10171 [Prescottella equi ATCC 33707]
MCRGRCRHATTMLGVPDDVISANWDDPCPVDEVEGCAQPSVTAAGRVLSVGPGC